MQLSNIPDKLVLPFANAGGKNSIPVNSQIGITAGAASLVDGFPPLTRTPIAAGGVPPSGLDMNGILYDMSAVVRWANAGGGYPYDSAFATDSNVGGYPKGARVARSDGAGYWFNTVDNNVTDPESSGSAAAGWVPDFTSGVTAITMTSSSVTLTASQYGKPIIVITGTLTANLNLILPTFAGGKWNVINSASGAFTITAKTALGAGVAIPTSNAISVFCDGTNIASADNPWYTSPYSGLAAGLNTAIAGDYVDVVRDFQARGDGISDDSLAFQNAIDKAQQLKTKLIVPSGIFRIRSPLIILDFVSIVGFGARSVMLRDFDNSSDKKHQGLINVVSTSSTEFIDMFNISNIKLADDVLAKGFSEFQHLINLGGSANTKIKDCIFEGFRGDAIYVGSGYTDTSERHNYSLEIEGCLIDGVNKNNRNAVSVLDVSNMRIKNCNFKNTTRSNMPGAIDLEPESSFNKIQDISVYGCNFENIGGTSGVVGFYEKHAATRDLAVSNINFYQNNFKNCDNNGGAFGCQLTNSSPSNSTSPVFFSFYENNVSDMKRVGVVVGAKSVKHIENTYRNIELGLFLGLALNGSNYDIISRKNKYYSVGKENSIYGGYAIQVSTNSHLTISDSFVDVGKADGSMGHAVYFVDGTSDNITIEDIDVYSPSNLTTKSIKKLNTHTFNSETNRFDNNKIINGSDFEFKSNNYQNYDASFSYTNIIEGISFAAVNSDPNTPTFSGTGILQTNKFRDPVNLNYTNTTIQYFYPTGADSVGLADISIYFRKISPTTGGWGGWLKLVGA